MGLINRFPSQNNLAKVWRHQRTCIKGVRSSWRKVTSGVPQGSVLGSNLFLIYINDLDSGVMSWILKFADDTKIYRRIGGREDRQQLQRDLDKLISWSMEWQMLFKDKKQGDAHR